MAEYFISSKPQSTGIHVIHREGCPIASDTVNMACLGTFNCNERAVTAGKKRFRRVRLCPFCLREHSAEPVLLSEYVDPESCVMSGNLRPSWDSVMLCGVN